MRCPKCAAEQPVTNKECPSCGIIFDRWQPRVPRRTTAASTPLPPPAVESDAPRFQIPTSYVAIGLVILAIAGFMWTKHVRDTRPKSSGIDATINEINNSGSKLRDDLQNRSNRGGVVRSSAMPVSSRMPADLDESKMRDMIESCSFFQNDVGVDIPKRVQAGAYMNLSSSNAMAAALRDHLIEFDPPVDSNLPYGQPVNVVVTQYASAKVLVSDNGASYRFGLGRRHVQITKATPSGSTVNVTFTWTLDQNDAADLAPEGMNPSGGADFQHSANGWTVSRVWQRTGGSIRYICP
jgi:hypothetical protein